MEYILNETPIRTSNNFKINNIKLELNISETNFNKYKIKGTTYTEIISENYNSKIGLESKKYNDITIDVNDILDDTIYINYDFSEKNNFLASKLNINLRDNSKSNIIIKYKSESSSVNNSSVVINAGKNSICNISILNLLSDDSKSFIAIENLQDDNSNININFIDIGGDIRVSNYYSRLNGHDSLNNFNNIYVGNTNDRIDMNYYVANINKNTNGNMQIYGVLNDNAHKTFKGTIDFIEGCVNSIGCENEDVILLSDKCKSKSLPMLLCHEENVSGAHGVSTGTIDEDKLFYIMSKGISYEEAKKLIIYASFNKILNILDDKLKNEITNKINNKI